MSELRMLWFQRKWVDKSGTVLFLISFENLEFFDEIVGTGVFYRMRSSSNGVFGQNLQNKENFFLNIGPTNTNLF